MPPPRSKGQMRWSMPLLVDWISVLRADGGAGGGGGSARVRHGPAVGMVAGLAAGAVAGLAGLAAVWAGVLTPGSLHRRHGRAAAHLSYSKPASLTTSRTCGRKAGGTAWRHAGRPTGGGEWREPGVQGPGQQLPGGFWQYRQTRGWMWWAAQHAQHACRSHCIPECPLRGPGWADQRLRAPAGPRPQVPCPLKAPHLRLGLQVSGAVARHLALRDAAAVGDLGAPAHNLAADGLLVQGQELPGRGRGRGGPSVCGRGAGGQGCAAGTSDACSAGRGVGCCPLHRARLTDTWLVECTPIS